jgi:stearoyl-CoA desaturase (delta-9 desaturase)
MLAIDILLFGYWGFLIWGIQMIWIPFWAAGVVNGLGHWIGYRNGDTKDKSKNLSFLGIIIGGEELHNNHHLAPASAKLSRRWFEFDIGWFYIKTLSLLGLATVG